MMRNPILARIPSGFGNLKGIRILFDSLGFVLIVRAPQVPSWAKEWSMRGRIGRARPSIDSVSYERGSKTYIHIYI